MGMLNKGARAPSIAVKLSGLAGVGLVVAALVGAVAFSSLSGLSDRVAQVRQSSVEPLGALANLRDAQGDSRVNVWRYLQKGADRAAVGKDMAAADDAVTAAIGAFLQGQGSGERADLMRRYQALHQEWEKVRDQQVRPLVDAGKPAAANLAVLGALADADTASAKPLDDLSAAEQTAAAALSTTAAQEAAASRTLIAALLLVGLVAACGAAWFMIRRVLVTVGVVKEGLTRLASGDLTWQCPPLRGGDELAAMAGFTHQATQALRQIVSRLDSTSQTVGDTVAGLGSATNGLTSTAADAIREVEAATSVVASVSHSVRTVATGSEQMRAAINEIASSALEASRVAQTGVSAALAADERVRQLGESSAEISQFVKVITAIAQQTNLLALNATIEAARAGEAGKGFAVVASEVKTLAAETAQATDQIVTRVSTMQSDTDLVVESIGNIREVIERINEMQTTVAGAVEEQSATISEINRSLSEAADATRDVTERVQGIAAATDQTQGHVAATEESACHLAGLAATLSSEVRAFTM